MREYVQKALQDLPALPQVLTRVLEETQREEVSASELEDILGTDQAVASRTLKVVNSAYYGLSKEVDSLTQATVILGIQQIRNLVLSISALSVMKSSTQKLKDLQQQFWLASIGTAFGAQSLARLKKLPLKEVELCFIGGLFHDLGRLFLFTNLTENYVQVEERVRSTGKSLAVLERAMLGMSHTEVGGAMARHWNFPDSLVPFLEAHEGPFTGDEQPRLFVVHIAQGLAAEAFPSWIPVSARDDVAHGWADLETEAQEAIRAEIAGRVAEFEGMFGLLAA